MKAALVGFLLLMGIPGLASAAMPRLNTNLNVPVVVAPPTPEPLVLRGVGTTWIEMLVNAPWPPGNVYQGSSTLYRQDLGGPWQLRQTFAPGTQTVIRDESLLVGAGYCYRLDTNHGGQTSSRTRCAETDWRVGFEALQIDTTQSAQVLALFDWHTTRPLPEGPADAPALYYMNVLVDHPHAPLGLWRSGIHVQGTPLFTEELAGWSAAATLVTAGEAVGRWHFAVVPGAAYNRLRQTMLDQIAAGGTPGIRALVFRQIPLAAARTYSADRHNLSYTYLGQQGFAFEAWVPCTALPGEGCIESEILGWIVHQVAAWVAEGLETMVEEIQRAIGRITRLVKGEAVLTLQFELHNTDFAFGDTPMFSAWQGQPLRLAGVRVQVRQGLGAFFGETDAEGRASIVVAKNARTEVCLETESHAVMLTEFLTEELVCFSIVAPLTADREETIRVRHPYFNVLAAMTDARQYLSTVVGHQMPQITVLVGGMAEAVALEGRSFAPCMGRVPNAGLGGGADLLALLIPVGVPAALAEFVYAVDIVLHPNNHVSRGVAVHEYGHVVMCDLLATQGAAAFQVAWTDVILATSDQTAGNETSYLVEAFADFFASQVVGGTNYFSTSGTEDSQEMNYCLANATCLERNYHELEQGGSQNGTLTFSTQVRRVATLLHDAFDGRAGVENPNDGSHWRYISLKFIPHWGHDSDDMDESIMLPGAALRLLFDYWHARGAYLTEETFLGGLADMARDYGYPQPAICDLFELHSSTRVCPTYAGGSGPVNGVIVKDQTFGVSDSAVVSPTGSGTTAPSVRAPLGGSVLSQ